MTGPPQVNSLSSHLVPKTPVRSGQPGAARVVVLSNSLWQGRFGGSPAVIGKKLILNGEVFTIVGVMPPGFDFPGGVELWVPPRFVVPAHPLRPNVDPRTMRGSHYFETLARLKPGVTLRQARADIAILVRHIGQEYPHSEARNGVTLTPLHEEIAGDVRPALLILLTAVGFLLLIACANVANLQLARSTSRQREMAVRSALGAGRLRIVRQLLTESLLLSLAGGGLGVLLARWTFHPLIALVPAEIRRVMHLTLNLQVLGFAILISVFTGLLFGLAPAYQASTVNLNERLKESGRSLSDGRSGYHLRDLLVISETALALLLLMGAGLLLKSFLGIERTGVGFDPENVLTMQISLSEVRYSKPATKVSFVERVLDRIDNLPGVRSAAMVTRLPLNPGNSARSITIEGRTAAGEDLSPDYNVATPGYFRTMDIPLLRGRAFNKHDTANGPPVVIVNEMMARRYWPNANVVGKHIKIGGDKGWRQVIGVVKDVRQHALWESSRPMMYVPYAQDPWPSATIAVRSAIDPTTLVHSVRWVIGTVDKEEPVSNVKTMDKVVSVSIAPKRLNALLLGLFAALALVLGAVGIYGVIAYSVGQRTHEIGVRMALGAQKQDVLWLFSTQGLRLVLAGVGIGIVASLGLTRLMASMLYGVKPTDPLTFITVSLILLGVALLACYIPARRAAKVDPVVALRHE
ncbi:MAG: ABC transporter permease [Terriglobia bacterium]